MLTGYIQNGVVLDNNWKPKAFSHKEGLPQYKRFFDGTGNFLLAKDESLLFTAGGIKVDIFDDWASSSSRNVGKFVFKGYRGAGYVFVTNKRIFHYRKMDSLKAGLDHAGTAGIPGAITDSILAKRGEQLGIFEYCEISLDILVELLLVDVASGKIGYYFLSNWDRYKVIFDGNVQARIQMFQVIEKAFRERELRRYNNGPAVSISYSKRGEVHMKHFWKRDDLIKKALRYEKKGKIEKAIVQYKKILEIFPDDEDTKNKIKQLSSQIN